MKRGIATLALSLLLLVLFSPLAAPSALAHGHITVGDYELVIGFKNEPAYQGEPNGLDLKVTNTKTNQPVLGLADTLKAEIIYGSSRRELEVRPQFGKDGYYTAHVLPSEAGDYTWRIYGTIEGTPVDVSMTSGPQKFNAVQPKRDVAFPNPEPSTAELRTVAESAQQTANTAIMVGVAGIVVGIVGIIVGFLGMRSRRAEQPRVVRQTT